jgi:GDP-L-fucose synthase
MKLLITGSQGLVGSALKHVLSINNRQYSDIYYITRKEFDLTKEDNVKKMYDIYQPDHVINTAASVGGILGNCKHHAEYFLNNTLINTYVIHYGHVNNVQKMINMSSTCIFPEKCKVFDESQMHEGPPFNAHFAYAYSKRMIDIQYSAYEAQFDRKNYTSIIPGNVFGPNDRFDIESGHVIPSLLLKFLLAKKNNTDVEIWGDGTPKREFIFSHDLANIMLDILELQLIPKSILVCSDTEKTIKSLVDDIKEATNFNNRIIWNTDKPNGQIRKKSDTSLLKSLLPNIKFTNFNKAISETYNWLENNYPDIRIK